MTKLILFVIAVLLLALWVASSLHTQQMVGPTVSTTQAQLTAVARPTPSPTP